jgi:hypothetical protein
MPAVNDRYLTAIAGSVAWTMGWTARLPRSAAEPMNFHYDSTCFICHLDRLRSDLILMFI